MTTLIPSPAGWPVILLARARSEQATDPELLRTDPAAALDTALAGGAFDGLKRAVRDLGPAAIIAAVAASGLRGRGGAGFPTGEKWRAAASVDAPRRYVVANGYGADPASRTDVALMELDPFAVVEGLAIAAFAVGASQAFIALRAEHEAVAEGLRAAIGAAEEAGLLGGNALGSGHDIEITVRPVQGAYMLGEETVLLKALESRRGQPEQRPPHPTRRGLYGMPTVVQNVQTLAAVPWIVRNGPEQYAALGSKASPGTILVSLRGPARDGLAEVPLGTPLRDVVALAGTPRGGRTLKAVLVGGPSGGILPPDLLDTPYEFDALRAVGAHVGSGSVVVADDRACVVDLARLLTRYCADEACGKSIPCRIGVRRLFEMTDRVATGRSRPQDPELIADLSADVVGSALCDHERLATLPLMSGMRYFRPELDEHILRSSCPAGVCHPIAVPAGTAH